MNKKERQVSLIDNDGKNLYLYLYFICIYIVNLDKGLMK